MSELRGSTWGPLPLPEFLTAQLAAHGFSPNDAANCAKTLRNVPGRAAAASLFVDLGSCKFLEGDIDGAVAAWRQAITSDHDAAAARALLNLGLMYEHLHLYERALTVLGSVADRAVSPHEVHGALALARCQRAVGDTESATETVALLASSTMAERPQAPELSEILLALGDLAHSADRPDRAERSWRIAVAGPDSPARRVAVSRLLQLSLEQGHDDEFIELLATDDSEQLITAAVLDRAEGLARLGHDDRTVELLAVIDEQALTSTERFRLADLWVHLGQVNQGIDQLEVLLASPIPEIWQRASFVLGTLYFEYEMLDVAGQMFDRVRMHPDRYWAGKAALARGDLFAMAGDHGRASELWAEASDSEVAVVRATARQRQEVGLLVEVAPDEFATGTEEVASPNPESDLVGDSPADETTETRPLDGRALDLQADIIEAHIIDLNELSAISPDAALAADVRQAEVVDIEFREASVGGDASGADAQVVDLHALSTEAHGEAPGSRDVDRRAVLDAVAAEPEVIVLIDPQRESAAPTDEPARQPRMSLVEPAQEPAVPLGQSDEADESVVVVLEPIDAPRAGEAPAPRSSASVFARLSDLDEPVELSDEVGSYQDTGIRHAEDGAAATSSDNPYASLAPKGLTPAISSDNPYAELAPSYDDTEFRPADDVEPGDWESMLDDWPASPEPPTGRGRRRGRPSAFSRYT